MLNSFDSYLYNVKSNHAFTTFFNRLTVDDLTSKFLRMQYPFVLSRFCEKCRVVHCVGKNGNKGGPAKFVPVKDSRMCSEH